MVHERASSVNCKYKYTLLYLVDRVGGWRFFHLNAFENLVLGDFMVVTVAVMEDDQLSTADDVDPASAEAAADSGAEPSIGGDGLDPFLSESTVTEIHDVPVPQAVYYRALLDAQLSISQDVSLKLPWESGVFGAIFGDEMLSLIQPSIPDTSVELSEQLSKSSHVAASVKRSADVPLHAAAMTDISDVDALVEEAAQLCETATSKWHFIFETTEWSGLIGVRLYNILQEDGSVERCRTVIRDVLGIKPPRTAIKRANTLRKYFKWV